MDEAEMLLRGELVVLSERLKALGRQRKPTRAAERQLQALRARRQSIEDELLRWHRGASAERTWALWERIERARGLCSTPEHLRQVDELAREILELT